MSLNRFAIRAKKSVSGLFSLEDGQDSSLNETTKPSHNGKENHTPKLEDAGSTVPSTSLACTDVKNQSPNRVSPSRRRMALGSLRRIGSLRSIRSPPTKTNKPDQASTLSETPHTPTQLVKSSLRLGFQKSPPDLEIPTPTGSTSSTLLVQHSSPINVPFSGKQEAAFSTLDHPSILPAGTIPDSPAPLQRALELDPANLTPSPASSTKHDLSALTERLPTPMPGTNLTFEDMHTDLVLPFSLEKPSEDGTSYFEIPLDDKQNEKVDYSHIQFDRGAAREAGVAALHECLATINGNAPVGLAENTMKSDPIERKPAMSVEAPESSHYILNYRRANGRRRKTLVSLSEDEVPVYNIEHIIWVDDSQPATTDKAIDKIGFVDSEMKFQKSVGKIGSRRRQTIWGRHTGLYDGTGYGDEPPPITPRSLATTEKTPEMPEGTVSKHHEVRADNLISEVSSELKAASPVPEAITTTAGDHETLEEVFRAYAVYEHQRIPSSTGTDKDSVDSLDQDMEKAVVDAVEDLDLSDRMMDANLGA